MTPERPPRRSRRAVHTRSTRTSSIMNPTSNSVESSTVAESGSCVDGGCHEQNRKRIHAGLRCLRPDAVDDQHDPRRLVRPLGADHRPDTGSHPRRQRDGGRRDSRILPRAYRRHAAVPGLRRILVGWALNMHAIAGGSPAPSQGYLAWYYIVWAVLAFGIWFADFREGAVKTLFTLGLWLTLLALALDGWTHLGWFTILGGYLGLVTSVIGMYTAIADLINESRGHVVLPTGEHEGAHGEPVLHG